MMQWTGDPYVDVGLATILAFRNKEDPAQLTDDDLRAMAEWIAENYARNPLKSFLTVAFTSNAWFAQPSFTPEKREERGKVHLFAWQQASSGTERCVFTGLPSAAVPLSDKLAPGRAARAQIPLTQGDEDINFYPNGDSGLAISGQALLCLQAFPLGCAKLSGRLLAVHASQPAVTLAFAREFLAINRKNIALAQQAGETKLPETRYGIGTLLVDTLMKIIAESRYLADDSAPFSIIAYHLTNGQTPEIAIYHLPLGVTGFLRLARTPRYSAAWGRIAQAALPRQAEDDGAAGNRKRLAKAKGATAKPTIQRNPLYEDLLSLPEEAPRFLRRYLLRDALHQAKSLTATQSDAAVPAAGSASWDLTELFLKEVMSMDKTRIEHIRALGDRLADYVAAENDRRFFRAFYSEQNYALLRNALLKANTNAVRRGKPPLITFDQFIEVFEEGEDIAYKDWKLARDLVLIRMIERLAAWLSDNADALPEPSADGSSLPEDEQT
ncbi:MAG: CRISPR-associated protein Cst1 [Candidatus Roseilinea sp.]|nr:MAG: CRISPR-associated protein Cst1 [Candidatus Roseilinea sp.]